MVYATGILILLSIINSPLRSQWFSSEGKSDYACLWMQSICCLLFKCRRDSRCGNLCMTWSCPPFLLHPTPPSHKLFCASSLVAFSQLLCYLNLSVPLSICFSHPFALNPFKDGFLPLVCHIWCSLHRHSSPVTSHSLVSFTILLVMWLLMEWSLLVILSDCSLLTV